MQPNGGTGGGMPPQGTTAAFDAVPFLVAFLDTDLNYRYANRAYRTWFGVEPGILVGQKFGGSATWGALPDIAGDRSQLHVGMPVVRRDVVSLEGGVERIVDVMVYPYGGGQADGDGYLSLVFDVTAEARASEALRQSDDRNRQLLRLCPDAVYVHRDFQLVYVNPAGVRMFGAESEKDLIGEPLLRFIDPAGHALAKVRYQRLMTGDTPPPQEFAMHRIDASPFFVRAVMAQIPWSDGPAVMIVAHDISRSREYEAKLKAARDEADAAKADISDAIESINDAFAVFSADERIEYFNSNYVAFLWSAVGDLVVPGVSFEQMLRARTRIELGEEASDAEIDARVQDALRRHRSRRSVTEINLPDGRWLRQAKRKTADGRVVAVYSDITEAKQREAALAESEERYRRVVEGSPDAILVSCDDEIVYANDAAVVLFGADKKNRLIGMRRRDFRIAGEEGIPELHGAGVKGSKTVGRPASLEYQKRRRLDGVIVDVDVSAVSILWYGREALLTTYRDVGDRIRVQSALEESERRLTATAANFPGAIYQRIMNGEGAVSYPYISPGIRFLLGIEPDEVMTTPQVLMEAMAPEDRPRVRERLRTSARNLSPYEIELPFVSRSGATVWLRSVARPRRDEEGNTVWDGVLLDTTELNAAREILQQAKDDAEAANDAKSRFLANVSHELRTPLNAVIGYAEVIRDEILGPMSREKYQQYSADIHASGIHLLNLINDILDLSTVEAGQLTLDESEFALATLVEDCQRIIAPAVRSAAVTLSVRLEDNLPLVRADPTKMRQVLLNLLSNAVKFTPEGGSIAVIGASTVDGGIAVTVRDSGIGIPSADLDKVLIPFGQVAHARSRNKTGTGLGLPLAKSLVESHGGDFRLTSEEGVGTSVTFILPVSRAVWQDSFEFGEK